MRMSQEVAVAPRPQLHRRGLFYEIVETIVLIICLYALADLASVRFFVDGPSMEPSFYTGQRVIVSRLNYMLENPQRGDIIVFQSPDNPGVEPPLIKRVIGLPGETVKIRDTHVFINGQELDESFTNEGCSTDRCRDSERTLGPDEYFVMGDNRNHSRDSRVFGPIKRGTVIGEALVRYWPPQDWSLLHEYRFPAEPFK
jgi:signal peptidase I